MLFVDEVKSEDVGRGGTCAVGLLLGAVDEETRDEFVAVLANGTWPGTAITRALNKRGHDITTQSVVRHRRRVDGTGCRCPL